MSGRNRESVLYRYGFNGKENDANGEFGSQLIQDYGFRMYNPSIGKFLSVDPLTQGYPELTPYQFASNTPIWAIDLDGLESYFYTYKLYDCDDSCNPSGTELELVHFKFREKGFLEKRKTKTWRKVEYDGQTYTFSDRHSSGKEDGAIGLPYTLDAFDKFIEDPTNDIWISDEEASELFLQDIYARSAMAVIVAADGDFLGGGTGKGTAKARSKAESESTSTNKSTSTSKKEMSARVKALPEALRVRPKWRQSTRDYLDKNNPKDANGNFIDVKTGLPITGKKHIGHQKESWREYQDNPANRNKTREQVIDDYNNVKNLGYESASSNSSNGAKTKGLENQ